MSSPGSAPLLPCCALALAAACHGGNAASPETARAEAARSIERAAVAAGLVGDRASRARGGASADDQLGCGRSVLRPRVPEVWDPILGPDSRGVTTAHAHRDPIFLDLHWAERDPHPTLYQSRGGRPPLMAFDWRRPPREHHFERDAHRSRCEDTDAPARIADAI